MNEEIGTAFNILDDEGKALRGLYLIDPDGVIVHACINNLPVGRNVDETLRLPEAPIRAVNPDEVCPANWTPGAATMLEDPKGSKGTSPQSADRFDRLIPTKAVSRPSCL